MNGNFRLSVDLSKNPLKITQIPDNVDRTTYSLMKNCFNCESVIGKTGLKKVYCKFCFRAFCSACLNLTAIHPETKNPEKICYKCYDYYARVNVVEAAGEYVEFCLEQEIKLREKAKSETIRLEERIKQLNEERIKKKEEHAERLKSKMDFLAFLIEKFEKIDVDVTNSADSLFNIYEQIANEDKKSVFDRFLENLLE